MVVPVGERSTRDRPDDNELPQIHVMYVLPADGTDESLDTSGVIGTAIESIGYWFRSQTDGLELRWDTYNGELDVTFYRLSSQEELITAAGAYVRDVLELELRGRGVIQLNKQYMVFYGGGSTWSCGGGACATTSEGGSQRHLPERDPAECSPLRFKHPWGFDDGPRVFRICYVA